MVKGKSMGGKKVIRKSVSLNNDTHLKLKKLAVSCDMPLATLASLIIEMSVNSPSVIQTLQDKYNKEDHYRIIPVSINGKVQY